MQSGTAFFYQNMITVALLEKLHYHLSLLVGLGEHRISGLAQDLVLGEVNHFGSHVGIADYRFGSLHIFSAYVDTFDRHFQSVLISTEVSSLLVNHSERTVENSDVSVSLISSGNRHDVA